MGYQLRVEKVTSLPAPASRTLSTLYYVKANGATEAELWVTANTGSPPAIFKVGATAGDFLPRLEALKTNFRAAQNVVSYQNNAIVTGAIIFIPPVTNDVMYHMTFEGVDYKDANGLINLNLNCFWYNTGKTWHKPNLRQFGDKDISVRLGKRTSDNAPVIILGETNTVWDYPAISLVNAVLGDLGATDAALKNWTSNLITSLSAYTIQHTVAPTVVVTKPDLAAYRQLLEPKRTSFRMDSDMVSYNAFGSLSGAIAFLAPASMSYCMMQLSFRGFDYAISKSNIHFDFTGYWYEVNNIWVNCSVTHHGDKTPIIRTARRTSDDRPAIIIGEVNEPWSYPMIAIVSAMLANDGANDTTLKGWTTELISDLSPFGSSVSVVGVTAPAASKLLQPRTITINGEVSGSATFDGSQDIEINVMPTTPRYPRFNPTTITDVLPTSARVNWSIANLNGYYGEGLRFKLMLTDVTGNGSETEIMEFPYDPTNRYSYTLTGLTQNRTYRVRFSVIDALTPDNYVSSITAVQFTTATVIPDSNSEVRLMGNTMTSGNIMLMDVESRGYKANIGTTDNELSTYIYKQGGGEADWKRAQIIAEVEARPLPVTYADQNKIRVIKSAAVPLKNGDRLLVRIGEDVEAVVAKRVTDIATGKHRDKPWRYAADDYSSRDWNNSAQETEIPGMVLSRNRYESVAVKFGKYIYVMGGTDGTTQSNTIDRITLTDGGKIDSVGLMPAASNLPIALSSAVAWVLGPYIYVAGGYNGTTWQNKVYRATPDIYGNISGWVEQTASPLSTNISNAAVAVYGGYVWIIGGKTNASTWTSNAMFAKVNADGTIGRFSAAPTGYTNAVSDIDIIVKDGKMFGFGGRSTLTAGITNIYVTEIADNGELAPWRLNPVAYSAANHDLRAVCFGDDVMIIGGYLNTTARNTRQYMPYTKEAGMEGLGTIATCAATTQAFSGAHVFLTGSQLIAVSNFAATTNKIYAKPVDAPIYMDTEIIEQEVVFDRPIPAASSVVYRDNREFLAGVTANGQNALGSVGPWWRDNPYMEMPMLPSGPPQTFVGTNSWARDAIAACNGYLLSAGGISSSSGTPINQIRVATLSLTGVIGGWVGNAATLPKPAYDQICAPYDSGIFAFGGRMQNGRSQFIVRIPFSSGGVVGTVSTSTVTIPRAVQQHDVFAHGKHLYLIGGECDLEQGLVGPTPLQNSVAFAIPASVRYITVRGKGSSTAPSFVYDTKTYTFPVGATDGVYTIAVHPDIQATIVPTIPAGSSIRIEYNTTVDGMNDKIYRISLDDTGGFLGSWVESGTMPQARAGFESVVYKDKVYIIGGYVKVGSTYSFPDTILIADIDTNGDLVNWTETPSYAWNTGACYALVRAGSKAYMVGGYNGSSNHLNVRVIDFSEPTPRCSISGMTAFAASGGCHLSVVVTRYASVFFGGKEFMTTNATVSTNGIRYDFPHWKPLTNGTTLNRKYAQVLQPVEYKFRDNVLTLTSPVFDAVGKTAIFGMRLKAYDALTSFNVKLWN